MFVFPCGCGNKLYFIYLFIYLFKVDTTVSHVGQLPTSERVAIEPAVIVVAHEVDKVQVLSQHRNVVSLTIMVMTAEHPFYIYKCLLTVQYEYCCLLLKTTGPLNIALLKYVSCWPKYQQASNINVDH
jgi:hypothetical protein